MIAIEIAALDPNPPPMGIVEEIWIRIAGTWFVLIDFKARKMAWLMG